MGYDEYIKAELFRRFPKHPSVPFYAFGNAAKADALYAAEGGWAKSHNWFSDHQLSDAAKELEGRGEMYKASTWEAIPVEKVLDFNEVFPTKSFYEGHKGSDVSSAWQQIARTSAISTLALKYTPLMRSKHPAHAAALSAAAEASGKSTLAVPAGEAAFTVWQEFQRTKDDPKWAEIAAQSGKRGLMGTSASSTPEMKVAYVPPAASPDGMQAAQAVMMQQFLTSRGNPMARMRRNPYRVTTGGQAVPYLRDELEGTWAATARHAQRHEEAGTVYSVEKMADGFYHVVDAKTGRPSGKYASSPEKAQQLAGKLIRRTNPDVSRRPSSRQVQQRQALRPHLHEQHEVRQEQLSEQALRARQKRQAAFVLKVQSVVDELVAKYLAMSSRGTTFTRWNVIDDLLMEPLIEKHINIYIEDPLTTYIVEAGKPAYRQKNRMLTGHLRDQAIEHIHDVAAMEVM